jgi:hypothetical protein
MASIRKMAILILAWFVLVLPARLNAQGVSGQSLLEGLYQAFTRMAETGVDATVKKLESLMTEATSAREANTIDAAFFKRYHRVLLVVRLSLITDIPGILKPLVDREFGDFIKDVTGKTYDPEGGATKQITQFSEAVDTEIMNLMAELRKKK